MIRDLEEPAPCPRTLALVSNPQRSSLGMHGIARYQNPAIGCAPNLETSSHSWGDVLDLPKPNRTFRFIFQNIQGPPVKPHSHKHQQFITALQETGADTFGMAKLNLNFRVLGSTSQWSDRFQKLRRNHSAVHTYNRHDMSQERLLFGGTAQITTGSCSHRATASGADESGMGRWVWTLFAGKNNIKLRVLSGYQPTPTIAPALSSPNKNGTYALKMMTAILGVPLLRILKLNWTYG
jgi:hypothetical protein